jgi:ubiquinone/menaquinone biosynthesis C-methylase UbiE
LKKILQNGRRRPTEREPEEISRPEIGTGDWNGSVVEHVRVVAGLIEGRRVGLDEILKMLARALRQHRLGHERRIDYIVGQLNKAPP